MRINSLTAITSLTDMVGTLPMTFDDLKGYAIVGVLTFLVGGGTTMFADYMRSPRQLTPEEIVSISRETVSAAMTANPYLIDKDRIFDRLLFLTQSTAKVEERFDMLYTKQQEINVSVAQILVMLERESNTKKKRTEDLP
jgi:hypothetical protein